LRNLNLTNLDGVSEKVVNSLIGKKFNKRERKNIILTISLISIGIVVITLLGRKIWKKIKKLLPHREPFIFVDEILEREEGKKITASKKVRNDEFWVKAHFPDLPVMPGVLIVEALAQASLLIFDKNEEDLFPIFVK